MAALRFEKASKSYDLAEHSVPALRDVTVTIRGGEFVALVGRSGCGKTTFLNLAGAMDLPTSGEVFVNGQSTSNLGDKQLTAIRRERVGFVFQAFHLFPMLNALENIEMPLQLSGELNPRGRARELLHVVGLDDLGDRLPYQLSGGQMQRVAIARALGHSPGLLLADEPMGNLDSETAARIMRLFRKVNVEFGTAIVMATHSRESAQETDRILVLRDGMLASDRPAGAVVGGPST